MTPDKADYEDAQKALKIINDVTDHVHKLMGQHANFKQLLELQDRFDNYQDLIKPGRSLIKEGLVQKQSRKVLETRHLILVNDRLIIGKF